MTQPYVRSGGVWKPLTPSIRSGGVWKPAQKLYRRIAGVWTQVFQNFAILSSNFTSQFTITGSTVQPRVTLNSDGSSSYADGTGSTVSGVNWGSPTTSGIGSLYWVNVTNVSGNGTMSGTFGSWLSLSAGQSWSMTAPGAGLSRSRHCTYQISSDSGGATIVGSGSMDFLSDRS